jgi:hypothetical protein
MPGPGRPGDVDPEETESEVSQTRLEGVRLGEKPGVVTRDADHRGGLRPLRARRRFEPLM